MIDRAQMVDLIEAEFPSIEGSQTTADSEDTEGLF
jgi:hypothetical protein